MHRRTLLTALAAGSFSLAGCLAASPGTTRPDDSTTTTSTTAGSTTDVVTERPPPQSLGESFETHDGRSVTVHDAWVQRSVVRVGTHTDVAVIPDRQFVVADVSVVRESETTDGSRSRRLDRQFQVSLDGTDYPRDEHVRWVADCDRDPAGYLLGFPVPVEQFQHVAVAWQDGDAPRLSWPLDADVRERIARAPAFEVRGFEVPDAVEREEAFEATLTVANVGDRDGDFLAELGSTDISDTPELSVEVPAGETVTHRERVDPYILEGSSELTLVLGWGSDRLERTVAVEN